jgi:DNA repair exonuclease SbcCD ATPase subunit
MTDLIRSIAQIDVPEDLLEQIDMSEVLTRFRQKFKQLDDLKRFREKHEQRNFIDRWWNNNELDDAQLDAQEVQAEFSKTVGQLMVISMLQSQRLEQQQRQLSKQQSEIKLQADEIAAHTNALEEQHGKLYQQAKELEDLVTKYFELRGLTQEGAKKLIAIATEVKNTRDDLLCTFDNKMQEAHDNAQALQDTVERKLLKLDELFDGRSNNLKAWVENRAESYDLRCATLEVQVNAQLDKLKSDFSVALETEHEQRAIVAGNLDSLLAAQERDRIENKRRFDGVTSSLKNTQAAMDVSQREALKELAELQQTVCRFEKALLSQGLTATQEMRKLKIVLGGVVACAVAAVGYAYYLIGI